MEPNTEAVVAPAPALEPEPAPALEPKPVPKPVPEPEPEEKPLSLKALQKQLEQLKAELRDKEVQASLAEFKGQVLAGQPGLPKQVLDYWLYQVQPQLEDGLLFTKEGEPVQDAFEKWVKGEGAAFLPKTSQIKTRQGSPVNQSGMPSSYKVTL